MNGYRMSASCEWTWTLPVLIAEFIDIVHIEAAYLNVHFLLILKTPTTSVKKRIHDSGTSLILKL